MNVQQRSDRWWLSGVVLASALALGCGASGGGGGFRGGPVNVVAVKAVQKPLPLVIRAVGTLSPNERTDVAPQAGGVVDGINFEEGQRVAKGTQLFCLNREKLQARLDQAAPEFELARTNLERTQALRKSQTAPQKELDEAESAFRTAQATLQLRRRELEDGCVKAPFRGVVGQRRVSPGQYVREGEPLAVLVDDDPIKADFPVPERFAAQLRVGQDVSLTVTAHPGRAFTGRVYFVTPEVDPSTRTVGVRALVPNADGALKPGMFGSMTLVLGVKERALVVPEAALILGASDAHVVLVDATLHAEYRTVKPGLRLDGEVEVLEGLAPGDLVIVEGHQKVGPGSPVNPLPATAPTAATTR